MSPEVTPYVPNPTGHTGSLFPHWENKKCGTGAAALLTEELQSHCETGLVGVQFLLLCHTLLVGCF